MPIKQADDTANQEVSKRDEPLRARVVRVHGETGRLVTRRVSFEGLEKDARKYVENNHPRPHIEEGNVLPPDVALQVLDGKKVKSTQQFHAEDGWSDYSEPDDKEDDE